MADYFVLFKAHTLAKHIVGDGVFIVIVNVFHKQATRKFIYYCLKKMVCVIKISVRFFQYLIYFYPFGIISLESCIHYYLTIAVLLNREAAYCVICPRVRVAGVLRSYLKLRLNGQNRG